MDSKPRDLMIFVKAPRPGFVKKRLGAQVGQRISAHLYRAFTLDLLSNLKAYRGTLTIWYYPRDGVKEIREWLGNDLPLEPQQGHDLGERMQSAFHASFERGAEAALLIGSDLPDLPQDYIHQAFKDLERVDAVIGPSEDGGYYLIGFTAESFMEKVFQGLAWGTHTVYDKTLEIFEALSLTYRLLPAWRDIDDLSDLNSLLRRNARETSAIYHTVGVVKAVARVESEFRSLVDLSCME